MNRKEIQKISLQYRTLSSQMLKMNSQEEMYCIQQFFDFISETEIIRNYINECKTQEYDFEQIFADKGWRNVLMLPAKQEELVSYGYQLLQTSVYKGYKQDKIEMRDDRAEMSDFPLYLNTVAGGLDRRDQTIGGFSFVVKIYAVPVVEIIG